MPIKTITEQILNSKKHFSAKIGVNWSATKNTKHKTQQHNKLIGKTERKINYVVPTSTHGKTTLEL